MMTASLVQAQVDYDKAIGLRAAWGFGLTGKMFINDDAHAIEAILNLQRLSVMLLLIGITFQSLVFMKFIKI